MKKLITLSIIALLLTCCNQKHTVKEEIKESLATASEIEKIVLDKEKDALNSWSDGSVIGYTKHFAEDVIYMDDILAHDGVVGLEAAQAYARSIDSTGMITKHNYELKNIRFQLLDNNVVLSFQYHPSSPDGTPGASWKASIVYAQRNEDWKVIHANWSFYRRPL
jgi:hypothetical protein